MHKILWILIPKLINEAKKTFVSPSSPHLPFSATPPPSLHHRNMPALTIPTNNVPAAEDDPDSQNLAPPAYSPITPEMTAALPTINNSAAAAKSQYPLAPPAAPDGRPQHTLPSQNPVEGNHTDAQPPPLVPISESDNPDAIALRAAMSILQLQRQQAIADMKTLEQQKYKALSDPHGFASAIQSGGVKMRSRQGVLPQDPLSAEALEGDEETAELPNESAVPKSDFGVIPSAQNVVRAPPINWAKYHVVGQSLDNLHEEQRRRPTEGSPRTVEDVRRQRERETVIAAPYDPFTDRLEKVEKGKRGRDVHVKKG